jgi:hypothetical protein
MFDFGFADIILVALGGLLILYSYSRLKKPGLARYTDHPLWLGLPRGLVLLLSGLQVLAAVGFLAAFFSWVANPPEEAETYQSTFERRDMAICDIGKRQGPNCAFAARNRSCQRAVVALVANGSESKVVGGGGLFCSMSGHNWSGRYCVERLVRLQTMDSTRVFFCVLKKKSNQKLQVLVTKIQKPA